MKLIDSISFPGSKLGGGMKTGTGDDRYAFDEAAGWACVIDGATDVGPVRIFSAAESDAARYAEIFAAEIVAGPADAREIPQAWFAKVGISNGCQTLQNRAFATAHTTHFLRYCFF